jgi:hypothetical protein
VESPVIFLLSLEAGTLLLVLGLMFSALLRTVGVRERRGWRAFLLAGITVAVEMLLDLAARHLGLSYLGWVVDVLFVGFLLHKVVVIRPRTAWLAALGIVLVGQFLAAIAILSTLNSMASH